MEQKTIDWRKIYENWFYCSPKRLRRTKWQLRDLKFQAKLFAEIFPDRFKESYRNIGVRVKK